MDTIEQKWIQSDKLEHKRTDVDTTRQKWTKSDLAPTDESSIFQDWIQMRWTVLPIDPLSGLGKEEMDNFPHQVSICWYFSSHARDLVLLFRLRLQNFIELELQQEN